MVRPAAFAALALLSGVCGLGYEVLYVRELTTLLGDALWVHAALLSTFLLGVGLGARLAHRAHRYLAAFEIGVGAYALLLPSLGRALGGSSLAGVVSATPVLTVLATSCLVAVPAVCIGFSLPLFSAYLHEARMGGRQFQIVYALYNAGAVLGVLLVEVVLVRDLGIAGSLRAAGLVNVGIGLGVILLGGLGIRRPGVPRIDFSSRTRAALVLASVASAVFQMFFLKSVYLTFTPHRENFAVGLAVILSGIALGTLLARRTRLSFGTAVMLAPAAAALSYVALPIAGAVYATLVEWTGQSFGLVARLGGAAVLGLPAMVFFGAMLPALMREERAVAEESGHLLWLSGAGNAAGYLLFVAVLHPLLTGSFLLAAVGGIALGAGWLSAAHGRVRTVATGVTVVLLVVLMSVWEEGTYQLGARRGSIAADTDIRFFRWGGESATLLRRGADDWVSYNGHRSIYARRAGVVNVAEVVSGILPGLSAPRLERAAVLGLGTGITAGAAARVFASVDVVEINGAFLQMAPELASLNLSVADQPNATLHLADGRAYLAGRTGEYDAVVNSIPAPTYYAASKIYTREFYERVKSALREDGIFATWLSPGDMTPQGLETVLATLSSVFPHCDLSILARGYYMATCGAQPLARRDPADVLDDADLVWLLRSALGPLDPAEYLADVRLSAEIFASWELRTEVLNTDDFPVLEFQVLHADTDDFSDPFASDPMRFGITPGVGSPGASANRIARRAQVYRSLAPELYERYFGGLVQGDPRVAQALEELRRGG